MARRSLPPGTEILIINAGNGHVLSFTVGNDGGAEDTLPIVQNFLQDCLMHDPAHPHALWCLAAVASDLGMRSTT